MERLKKLNLDFSDEAVFDTLMKNIVRALETILSTKKNFSVDNNFSVQHVHRAILAVKENNPAALECIKIRCKNSIWFAPPASIRKMSGKSGSEIAEMTLEDFEAYMKTLK